MIGRIRFGGGCNCGRGERDRISGTVLKPFHFENNSIHC